MAFVSAFSFPPCKRSLSYLGLEPWRVGDSCLAQKLSQQAGSSGARGAAEATKSSKVSVVNVVWVAAEEST